MDNLFNHLLIFGLSCILLVDCYESRISLTSIDDNMKKQSILNHQDGYMKVMSHALMEQQRKPSEGDEDLERAAMVLQVDGEYYGAKATFEVYDLPQVGENQSSYTVMALVNKEEMMMVGWHVAPEVYGDHDAHFFTYWFDGVHVRGCLNMNCSQGFVLDKSSKLVPGSVLHQKNITLKLSKNRLTGDWMLHSGVNGDMAVGYWSKSLFTDLADNVSKIGWGGVVHFYENQKSPPMGNGHLPNSDQDEEKAASISKINVISKNGEIIAPKYDDTIADDTNCYRIIPAGDFILYGGPGGCTE